MRHTAKGFPKIYKKSTLSESKALLHILVRWTNTSSVEYPRL